MYAVGAILSLPANKRLSIRVVVWIASINDLPVEVYVSKALLRNYCENSRDVYLRA